MKKISSILMWKKRLMAHQSLWSLGSNGIAALSGMILFGLSSSRLSASDFGIWVLFQTGSGLMDMFRVGLLLPGFLQMSAGKDKSTRKDQFSSVLYVFLLITLTQMTLCFIVYKIIPGSSSWSFFFHYYPLIIFSTAVITLGEWWFQSMVRFQNILFVRVFNRLLLIIVTISYAHNLEMLVYVQVGVNLFTSLIILWYGKVPLILTSARNRHYHGLFRFGRYSTPTQLASNLLRSSDTLIISNTLGTAAVGIYGAAAKFLEFIELPIRSQGALLFNQLAKLSNENKQHEAFRIAKRQITITTLWVFPVALLLGVFAPFLIEHVSGDGYLRSIPLLRIMSIYCLLIPADRCLGLLLEAYGRPDLNLLKVVVMLVVNLIGDSIAVFVFETPFAVACSSIITFSIGVAFGFWLITANALHVAENGKFRLAIDKT